MRSVDLRFNLLKAGFLIIKSPRYCQGERKLKNYTCAEHGIFSRRSYAEMQMILSGENLSISTTVLKTIDWNLSRKSIFGRDDISHNWMIALYNKRHFTLFLVGISHLMSIIQ